MTRLFALSSILLAVSLVAPAQHDDHRSGNEHQPAARGRVGGGYIPEHGPPRTPESHGAPAHAEHQPPPSRGAPARPEHEASRNYRDAQGHPNAPHVDPGGRWVGHDEGRDDARFHLAHPYPHGHFTAGLGREHVWVLRGGNPNRFWFNNFYWSVAAF